MRYLLRKKKIIILGGKEAQNKCAWLMSITQEELVKDHVKNAAKISWCFDNGKKEDKVEPFKKVQDRI